MSAQVTEAHKATSYAVIQTGNVIDGAQLIADSEARALGLALAGITCTHHTDKERHECPVCLVTQLRAEVAKLTASFTPNGMLARENESMRAEVEKAKGYIALQVARAERAEAELTKERARSTIHASFCDDALTLCEDTGIAGNIIANMRELRRAAIDSAMKEDGK